MLGHRTIGNSNPLATHTVMICTASSSDSTRRDVTSVSRSVSTCAATPCAMASSSLSKPEALTAESPTPRRRSSPRCSRSVTERSPSRRPRTRATTPESFQTARRNSTTPLDVNTLFQATSWFCTRSRSASDCSARLAASYPPNHDTAKVRARRTSDGRTRASSSQRSCTAAGLSNTLAPRASTAGTPLDRKADCTCCALSLERTSTAMSGGLTARRAPGEAPGESSGSVASSSRATAYATRSAMTAPWATGAGIAPLSLHNSESVPQRISSPGARTDPSPAPSRRFRSRFRSTTSTSLKEILSPKTTPSNSAVVAANTLSSDRQFVPSVRRCSESVDSMASA